MGRRIKEKIMTYSHSSSGRIIFVYLFNSLESSHPWLSNHSHKVTSISTLAFHPGSAEKLSK